MNQEQGNQGEESPGTYSDTENNDAEQKPDKECVRTTGTVLFF